MPVRKASILLIVGMLTNGACGGGGDDAIEDEDTGEGADQEPDAEEPEPAAPAAGEWIKVEPEGALCGNGSQYKFFVNYSETSDEVVVAFEPGGACWDYDSCTGKNGVRGAANPDGIPDGHMTLMGAIVPLFRRKDEDNPARDWNQVFVPYCTGDVHTGNASVTYEDPSGEEPPIEFHHNGHANVQAVIDWMAEEFPTMPRLMVTGCSAGGAGATINYFFLRSGLPQAEKAYLLADSGPIFPTDSFSGPLHEQVYQAWQVESILGGLPEGFDPADFGSLNTAVADAFPEDRLAATFFQRDFNYSLYSYERFYDLPPPDRPAFKDRIMEMWSSDTQELVDVFDSRDNLAYYLPYWRSLNDSHCSTVVTYDGSEIEEADMTMDKYVANLLDDEAALESYMESPQPGEDD
jgi:Pectinacetylesterase